MGSLDHIGGYSLIHPKLKTAIFGKLFLEDLTGTTGTGILFNISLPHTEIPYFHRHIDNEETYIIQKGSDDFQIDDDCFPVREGSVVCVSPAPSRA